MLSPCWHMCSVLIRVDYEAVLLVLGSSEAYAERVQLDEPVERTLDRAARRHWLFAGHAEYHGEYRCTAMQEGLEWRASLGLMGLAE